MGGDAGLVDGTEPDAVVLQDVVREEVHPLGEILVEDEAEDVVPELIRPHFPPQGVGDIPELGLELLLVVFGHTWKDATVLTARTPSESSKSGEMQGDDPANSTQITWQDTRWRSLLQG